MRSRPLAVVAVLAALLGGALLITSPQALETFEWEYAVAGPRPQRDTTFGARILRLSEEGGYFDTDNLISNERSYLHVAPALRSRAGGGAYIGVGPDQNFAYIALLRPEIAYIIDIRRDNVLQHLLFKALFERCGSRLEYLAGLTGRVLPDDAHPPNAADVTTAQPASTAVSLTDRDGSLLSAVQSAETDAATLQDIVAWIDRAPLSQDELERVHRDVRARIERYGYPLTEDDYTVIRRIHETFAREGLSLRFSSHGRAPQPHYPTYRDLLLETDRAGTPSSAFSDEASYALLRRMQLEDRIVPVVGDFAGPHALRAIADDLKATDVRVKAFYTSNVEYYLFRNGAFLRFADNAATLPWHDEALIIRSVFRGASPDLAAHAVAGYGSIQVAQPARSFLERNRSGGYATYAELTAHDVLPPS